MPGENLMTSPSWLPPEVVAAIESGRRIDAVKLLRESRGLGLAEAKEAVDAYARSRGVAEAAPAPDGSLKPVSSGSLSPAAPRKWGGLLWVLILLFVAGYLVYRFLGGAL
jgi:hypothetical protein